MQTLKTTTRSTLPWRLLLATLALALVGGMAQTALAAPPDNPISNGAAAGITVLALRADSFKKGRSLPNPL